MDSAGANSQTLLLTTAAAAAAAAAPTRHLRSLFWLGHRQSRKEMQGVAGSNSRSAQPGLHMPRG